MSTKTTWRNTRCPEPVGKDCGINKRLHAQIDSGYFTSVIRSLGRSFRGFIAQFWWKTFKSEDYSVSDFVHSLVHLQDYANLLSYEETLKYATFPALDLKTDDREIFGENIQYEHREIFKTLDWLKHKKKVEHIIELIVLDRLVNPHEETKIGTYVKDFKVEILNWRLLDLSISVFDDSGCGDNSALQQIRELHLYASGKLSVISHWLSEDGIGSLKNLTTLEIYVVQELSTREKCRVIARFIERRFRDLSNKINEERQKMRQEKFSNNPNAQDTQDDYDSWKLTVSVSIRPWNPTEEREADLEEIAERAVPKLSRFIKGYQPYVHDVVKENSVPFRPTRVALIDNGILSISPLVETPSATSDANNAFQALSVVNLSEFSDTSSVPLNGYQNEKDDEHKTLWPRVKKGQPFVDDESRVSSWLFASDPHGTQMANLICAIDPCCDLYVAKVAEGRSGIIPARVERAVRWAISLDVDIISMSFAILEGTEGLADACEAALYNGIIILCSTPDEGLNTDKSCISDYNGAMTITACDGFGIVSPNSPTYYDYTINGMNVAAGKVPFLESKDCISGSSVSTAIAAGLSSLILACERLAKNRQDYKRGERSKIIKHYFGKMTATSKNYIILEKFADIDKKIKDG
ncbi:peptidase S8/S53 domain-containing protein [Trichoderma austrokoningii]